jgi:hypothetical protein
MSDRVVGRLGRDRQMYHAALLVMLSSVLCVSAFGQVGVAVLQSYYQDLRSSDSNTRGKAFEAIRNNREFLEYPETADQFLGLMTRERQEVKRLVALGADVEGGLYEEVLGAAWELWKDRLTPSVFRSFAEESYNADSAYARELGTRAGRFVSTLLPLASSPDKFVRENATALVGYALAEDQAGTVRLSPEDRGVFRKTLTAASADRDYGVRIVVVRGLKMERDAWAIPVLEKMYEREPSLHPAGDGQLPGEILRSEMKEGIQAVRFRGQMPSQDFDELQVIYRALQSRDAEAKSQALNAVVKREDFLSFVDTPDRLLRLLDLETSAIRSRAAPEKGSASQGNAFYETLLTATWQAWKDKLTYASFRVLAGADYDPASPLARELGSQAGRFPGAAMQLADPENPPTTRTNGVLMLAYALAEDEKGAVHVKPDERRWSTQVTARAAEDRDPAIRLAVVNAAKLAGGAWAIPILEQMYEREASFDPSGKNRQNTEALRGNVKAAIQSIQSRTGK